jgi:hypothetical protein
MIVPHCSGSAVTCRVRHHLHIISAVAAAISPAESSAKLKRLLARRSPSRDRVDWWTRVQGYSLDGDAGGLEECIVAPLRSIVGAHDARCAGLTTRCNYFLAQISWCNYTHKVSGRGCAGGCVRGSAFGPDRPNPPYGESSHGTVDDPNSNPWPRTCSRPARPLDAVPGATIWHHPSKSGPTCGRADS